LNNLEYLEWLNQYNISRPHKTGRWRVWWKDTLTAHWPPGVIVVADFESFHPSETEWGHFCRWRDSDERRHKQNAAGFLRFAKHRHLIDGSGENQVKRVKEMCANIRAAMIFFSQNEPTQGEAFMSKAWGAYMMLSQLSTWPLINTALKHKDSQRKKGIKRGEQIRTQNSEKLEVEFVRGRGNVSEIINELALKLDWLGDYLSPKDDLWPELLGIIDERGLRPVEKLDNNRIPVEINYRDGDGKPGCIKFSSFKAMISKARKVN
jgi:hypothetical protein